MLKKLVRSFIGKIASVFILNFVVFRRIFKSLFKKTFKIMIHPYHSIFHFLILNMYLERQIFQRLIFPFTHVHD